ncbi:hypothetical protein NMY22_g15275 [Coprinellus aureogranulatus]|nr:hypothetical protein NMY22_g15275 [Coprinellus aureogranulatus]
MADNATHVFRLFPPRSTPSSVPRIVRSSSSGSQTMHPLDPARRQEKIELGPGWLYDIGGTTFYSPNCYRPDVKAPAVLQSLNAGSGNDMGLGGDRWRDRYQSPQWWTKASGYLAFTPLLPDLSAPPLHPLLQPSRWKEWQALQDALTESCHLLLNESGAAAVRSVPHPCSQVDRGLQAGSYRGRRAKLHRDILSAHSWFYVWIGCLSYAIGVNEAISQHTSASLTPIPLPWVEVLLTPYRRHVEEIERRKRLGLSNRPSSNIQRDHLPTDSARGIPTSHQSSETYSTKLEPPYPQRCKTQLPTAMDDTVTPIITPSFVSNLRNTCIACLEKYVERVGVFVAIPETPEDMVSIDWLLQCNVPVWYVWGEREDEIATKYPILRRYKPHSDATWATSPSKEGGLSDGLQNVHSTSSPCHDACPLPPPTVRNGRRYERRRQLGDTEKPWEEFFAISDSRVELLKQTETAQAKTAREARERDPPLTRPEAKFYIWERGMRRVFRRRVATDEDLEGLFEASGRFGRNQARYCPFFNEWDLCQEFGPPMIVNSCVVQTLGRRRRARHLSATRLSTPSHSENQISMTPSESAVHDPHHLIQRPTMELEDGEMEDFHLEPEALSGDIPSNAVSHAYRFLGFTLPADTPRADPVPPLEKPAHTPRLLGIPGGSTTAKAFWDSWEGQNLILFSKRLASNSPPDPSSWDLHPWNVTPVASLPLFRRLRARRGPNIVQIEKWDNVEGRSQPILVTREEIVFWFDVPYSSPGAEWFLGSQIPTLVLSFCRLGIDCRSDPLSIATFLAGKGVPFNTWVRRSPQQLDRLKYVRTSPHLIPFRLESDYRFGEGDYREYERCRRRLMDGPAGRAAVRYGGIIWRLAMQDVGIREALSGIPSDEALRGQGAVHEDGQGGLLVDECLNHDELMAICGEYEIGIASPGEIQKVSEVMVAPTRYLGRESWIEWMVSNCRDLLPSSNDADTAGVHSSASKRMAKDPPRFRVVEEGEKTP